MARRSRILYRATATCDCGWRGERRTDLKREPAETAAHLDKRGHAAATGHTALRVEAWWSAKCHTCNVTSPRCQQAQQVRRWIEQHNAIDPKHQRRVEKQQEYDDIADRILGLIRP